MNNIFFANHCIDHWRYETGCRWARKIRGYTTISGLWTNREDVGFSIEADGTHVFLKKNAKKLGYTRDSASDFRNKYRRTGFLLEVTDQNGRKGYVLPENVIWP